MAFGYAPIKGGLGRIWADD